MAAAGSAARGISGIGAAPARAAPRRAARAGRRGAQGGKGRRAAARAAEETARADPADARSVVGVVLGGGAGTRLYPLTASRAKPAVPIGGAYRLIDIPMSNCINSNVRKIYVLTQFNSTSLNRHISRTYGGASAGFGSSGFVEVLAATQSPTNDLWYQGTADAVRQYLWLFESAKNKDCQDVLILSGDHLYRADYMDFVGKHRESGADITISCLPMDDSRAADFGLMKIDDTGRIVDFAEKPEGEALEAMQVDTTVLGLNAEEAKASPYIASMGIYVFRKDVLVKLLERFPTFNDFGSEIIPAAKDEYHIQAFLHQGYWEDIGTVRSFFDSNLALTDSPPAFEFYDAERPIYTSPRFLPPSNLIDAKVSQSIISHGCNLNRCTVHHSVVGLRSNIEEGATLEDTLMIGADFYETSEDQAALLAEGLVPLGVGAGSTVKGAILDKNARIGQNCQIVNKEGVQEANREEEGFYIRSGVMVVMRGASIPDGFSI